MSEDTKVGYIEFFGLIDWYEELSSPERNALQRRIPGLMSETYIPNIKNSPGIYSSLYLNIDAPRHFIVRSNEFSTVHILAHVYERNTDNSALMNQFRNGPHEYMEREFLYMQYMGYKALSGFYAVNRELGFSKRIRLYQLKADSLETPFKEHHLFLRIRNLDSLVTRYKQYYRSAFIEGNRTPETHPELFAELTNNISKHEKMLEELRGNQQNSI